VFPTPEGLLAVIDRGEIPEQDVVIQRVLDNGLADKSYGAFGRITLPGPLSATAVELDHSRLLLINGGLAARIWL
jgi:hypothetical protein